MRALVCGGGGGAFFVEGFEFRARFGNRNTDSRGTSNSRSDINMDAIIFESWLLLLDIK